MSTTKTNADALGFYLSSSESGNVSQRFSAASLGGYRSAVEVERSAVFIEDPIAPVRVDMVFGSGGGGSLFADTEDTLKYTPDGGTAGSAVSISEGETKLIEGNDPDEAVRVTREAYDEPLLNTMTINQFALLESPVALDIVPHAERAAGSTKYRAFFIKAHGSQALSSLKFWNVANGHAGVTYALALEAPSSDAIQTIADEDTAPTGLTWDTGTTSGTGLSLANLAADAEYGLWVRRVIATDTDASDFLEVGIGYQFVAGGVTYEGVIRGAIRLADSDLDRYELYEGEDADPDFDSAPATTSASLPFTHALTPPVSGETQFRHVILKSNEYGMKSLNRYQRTITIDNAGAEVVEAPTAPRDVTLEDVGGGIIRVTARYDYIQDDSPADRFSVRHRADGVDPVVGTDDATLHTMDRDNSIGGTVRRFTADLGPFVKEADVRVLVRTHRTSDSVESTNTTASQIDVDTIRRTAPKQRRFIGGRGYGQEWPITAQTALNETVYIDQPNNVFWTLKDGVTELWADTALVFRIKYDGADSTNRGIWTTYQFVAEEISGTAAAEPVEVASWTMGDKRLFFTVEGQRRLLIDVTNEVIKCRALTTVPSALREGIAADVALSAYDDWHTILQVKDRYVDDYQTVASLTGDGILALRVPWRQRDATGNFE